MTRQATLIASGCSSHRRVEPTKSLNRNVTVPVAAIRPISGVLHREVSQPPVRHLNATRT